ncbi:MAG: tRNA (adenosine(37)-N6)-threonylcarbamoyltransferase complex dimerization subunit type 1 TsaB [Turicibacter sp.]
MFILAMDTSNITLSVALVDNGQVLAQITEQTKNDHSKRLMPAIEALFKQSGRTPKELDCIAVAQGPGSYTGVRIGVTVAKTMAWTLNKPLVGVSSLEVLALNVSEDALLIPLFDARRETVFAGVYDGQTHEVVMPDGHYELRQLLANLNESQRKMYFLGNDAVRYFDIIVEVLGDRANLIEDSLVNIPQATLLANRALSVEPVENVHTFVPTYHRLPEAEINWLSEQSK